IKSVKADINNIVALAKETTEEYQSLKKKVITAQNQYPELRQAYLDIKKAKQAQTDEITKELDKLAKDVDPEVLRKYQAKRSERIFPIICEIKADRCSKCGIELSIADKEKVAAGKVVECENCHRILYRS
ncbi:MAG: hypothetical protein K2J61_03530, partial [Clostridia bacterium]|nr:hypothetical protein [Clostridia bacterium]